LGVILNIPLAVTQALGSLVATFVIDKLGRRYIMLRTLPGAAASMGIISVCMSQIVYSGDAETVNVAQILFMVFLISFLAFYAVGYSSTPWAVQSEIFPIHLVGTGCALATATNWISNFAVSSIFLTVLESDAGKVYAFAILSFFGFSTFIFVYVMVPETAQKTIVENLEAILGKKEELRAVPDDIVEIGIPANRFTREI